MVDENETQQNNPAQEWADNQRESIKLIKNSRGYNWEIRVFLGNDDNSVLERLEMLNREICKRFEGVVE
jgi:hypothetical protein